MAEERVVGGYLAPGQTAADDPDDERQWCDRCSEWVEPICEDGICPHCGNPVEPER